MYGVFTLTTKPDGSHLICGNCGMLLDCDWMGISLDYDDECKFGVHHWQQEVKCDCESRVNNDMNKANETLSGASVKPQ